MRPSDYVRGYPQNLARPRWVSVLCTYLPSMPRTLPISRCSSGKPLQFRWFGYPPSPQALDLETATEKFLSVVTGSNRELNDYVVAMAKAEFRHTLKLAISGQLSPSRHVKPIERSMPKRVSYALEISIVSKSPVPTNLMRTPSMTKESPRTAT